MDSYGAHMFTDAVQAEQARAGTKDKYSHVYERRHRGPLDTHARAFIETRDSFYMASVGQTGWPYVQHRGGPPGFLKVMGDEQVGFADYTGNKQFISKGNFSGDDRVALILMDYPRRARLKLIGRARMVDAGEAREIADILHVDGEGPVERVTSIAVTAIDWNCPKYITPRFTEAEIEAMLGPRIGALQQEIETLRARVAELEAGDPTK